MEPTPAEQKVITFCTEHPKWCQKKVAEITGYHQSFISRTWHKFLPERIRHINKDEPTDLDKKIIAYYHAHPNILQKDIAEALHCHRSSVSWTIGKYITGAVRRKQRNYSRKAEKVAALPEGSYTLKPCLGYCGGMHKSTDKSDRVCPSCKARQGLESAYIEDHRVYAYGHGRV